MGRLVPVPAEGEVKGRRHAHPVASFSSPLLAGPGGVEGLLGGFTAPLRVLSSFVDEDAWLLPASASYSGISGGIPD